MGLTKERKEELLSQWNAAFKQFKDAADETLFGEVTTETFDLMASIFSDYEDIIRNIKYN